MTGQYGQERQGGQERQNSRPSRLYGRSCPFCPSCVSVIVLILLAAPAVSRAQGPASCTVQLDSVGGQGRQIEVAPGVIHQFLNGGVWARCRGDPIPMRADSVAWYSDRNKVDFIRHLWFDDSPVTLQ